MAQALPRCDCGTQHRTQAKHNSCPANQMTGKRAGGNAKGERYANVSKSEEIDPLSHVSNTHVGAEAKVAGADTQVKRSRLEGKTAVKGGQHSRLDTGASTFGSFDGNVKTSGVSVYGGPFTVSGSPGEVTMRNTVMKGNVVVAGDHVKIARSTLSARGPKPAVVVHGKDIDINGSVLTGSIVVHDSTTISGSEIMTDQTVRLPVGTHILGGKITEPEQIKTLFYGENNTRQTREHKSVTVYPNKKGERVAAFYETGQPPRVLSLANIGQIQMMNSIASYDDRDTVLDQYSPFDLAQLDAEMRRTA